VVGGGGGGCGRGSVCVHVGVCMYVCVHASTCACVLEKRGMGEGQVCCCVLYEVRCFESCECI